MFISMIMIIVHFKEYCNTSMMDNHKFSSHVSNLLYIYSSGKFVMFVVEPNVTSIIWNCFGLKVNEGGMSKDKFLPNFY